MSQLIVHSAAEQVADHLREQIRSGIWQETIAGGHRLASELGVNHKTAEAALRQLEAEGLLKSQGSGRPRRIVAIDPHTDPRSIRIAIFVLDITDRAEECLIELRHLLEEAGHTPFYPEKTLLDLGMDADRVAQFVKHTEADAWIICAGSREILTWFSQQTQPAFAFVGRRDGLPIAGVGPDKVPPYTAATRQLIELGHQRITFLTRRHHRRPEPTPSVRAFVGELEAHGIRVGDFNLPDWEESRAGFQAILESLFRLTPPTAIFTDEAFLFTAAQQFLAKRGIRVPEDVSLICTDSDPNFAWCDPSIAHIHWDYLPVVRRVIRWATNVSHGKSDLRQTSTKADYIHGGTVGPAKLE
ncbi:MAG: hypothetical protein ACI8XO_003401 [Verrucomicrobiales bacterium]|jgi:hypothetical protein